MPPPEGGGAVPAPIGGYKKKYTIFFY